jgi:hypothetical protein
MQSPVLYGRIRRLLDDLVFGILIHLVPIDLVLDPGSAAAEIGEGMIAMILGILFRRTLVGLDGIKDEGDRF